MLFEIKHVTKFSYSSPVFLEPHTLRLRPRCDVSQHLLNYELNVEPDLAGQTECIDLDGNSVTRIWFSGNQRSVSITTRSTVEPLRHNPFDYVLDSESLALPVEFGAEVAKSLSPYMDRSSLKDEVFHFSRGISDQADGMTLPFLTALTRRIYESFECFLRPEGDPWDPSVTLAIGRGACRDLAVLEMEAIRAAGLPARFVSGYRPGDPKANNQELHAWVEVYLPGAGWRGYDPTTGLAVSDGHVALAAGSDARIAAPTSGSFRGTGVTSSIWTSIEVRIIEG